MHVTNIILGLALIRSKLTNPAIVVRSTLLHVPEAIVELFDAEDIANMLSYGWEENSAEKGYMYRLNKPVEEVPES